MRRPHAIPGEPPTSGGRKRNGAPPSASLQAFSSGRYCSEGERDALLTQITRQPSAPWSTASNWSFRCPPPASLLPYREVHAARNIACEPVVLLEIQEDPASYVMAALTADMLPAQCSPAAAVHYWRMRSVNSIEKSE